MQVGHSLTGYVRIQISGAMPERLVNLCMVHNILLRDIVHAGETIEALISVGDFRRLRPLVKRAGVRVRILQRYGLPFHWQAWRRRPVILLLTLLFTLLLYGITQFIWFVQVVGPGEHLPPEEVLAAAAALGLKPGAFRPAIDRTELARQLVMRQPAMAWAHISFRGVRATIEVVEKVLPPAPPLQGPGDIVARRSGLIEDVLVLSGESRVEPGDTVAAGDVLIQGVLQVPAPQEEMPVPGAEEPPPARSVWLQAKGEVLARTWYEAYREVQLEQQLSVPTGREARQYWLEAGSKQILLYGSRQSPFSRYETVKSRRRLGSGLPFGGTGWALPVAVLEVKFLEEQIHSHQIDAEQAEKEAQRLLREELLQQIPASAQIVSFDTDVVQQGDNFVGMRLTVECLEDIGWFQLSTNLDLLPPTEEGEE